MSRIKSKWTQQEVLVHNFLKGNRIKHKMHPDIPGSPDIILKENKTAIFLHGCFWHKCPVCYIEPKSNKEYWIPKINKNVIRDRHNKKILEKKGYKVIIIWEHEVKDDILAVVNKIAEKS